MSQITRRTALQMMGISSLGLALPGLAWADTEIDSQTENLTSWIHGLQANATQLREQRNSPLQWQEVMDRLYADVPLNQLKRHLSFTDLSKTILEKMPADRGEFFHRIELPTPRVEAASEGPEPRRVLITKVAHVRKGHSIPPHGHSNMVSAFLCLSGEFEVRLYDRLDQRAEHMVMRATSHQAKAGAGTWSSVSDYRDNVHWLTAKSDDCFLFTCKMLSVEPGIPLNGRINVDMHRAKELGKATYLAPLISHEEAREIY